MEKTWLIWILTALAMTGIARSDAEIIPIQKSGVVITHRKPLQALIVDGFGKAYQQTVYYDPWIEGVEVNLSWAGPSASIYFPELDLGYIWYKGHWVDESGDYWAQGQRFSIGEPSWKNQYWANYWRQHWNDSQYGHWHDNWGNRANPNDQQIHSWPGGMTGGSNMIQSVTREHLKK